MRLKKTYSSREVAALTGLTARQLQLWDAGGLLSPTIPSHKTAAGGYTERRYTPIHVEPAAPRGASKRAAAVQAAYATLLSLYASQKTTFLDPKRAESLAAIAGDSAVEDSVSIARGIEWGQTVADEICLPPG